jgi:hypothetical protein
MPALKRLLRWILFLLLPSPLLAQTATVVTGTIKDPGGYAYSFGTITAQLIPSTASPTISINGVPTSIQGVVLGGLDSGGNFTMGMYCNTAGGGCSVISPGGTQWQFTVCHLGVQPPLGTGPQCFSLTTTITGASQSLSTALNAVAPKLSTISAGASGGGGGQRDLYTCFFPAALTTTWTGCTMTLDKAIVVTRVQTQLKTGPSGCSPAAVIAIGGGGITQTLANGQTNYDSGSISVSFSAGANLSVAISTAAVGCGTPPADANVVVQFRGQVSDE